MKTSIFFQLSVCTIICLTVFNSCNVEDGNLEIASKAQILQIRSGGGSPLNCENLIENGDFSEHDYIDYNDCYEAFQNGLVSNWTNAHGSPDLWYYECGNSVGPNSTPCTANLDHAIMFYNLNTSYVEGILTDIELTSGQDIFYSLCFNGSGGPSGSDQLVVFLSTGLEAEDPVKTENNLPNLTGAEIIYQSILAYSGPHCGAPFYNYYHEFEVTNSNLDQIVFYSSNEDPEEDGVIYIDDIEIHCHSKYLTGINADSTGNCEFSFSSELSGQLNIVAYHWDFGDGNTSTSATPTHAYSNDGSYNVTLWVKDSRGCCTKATTMVSCGDDCLSYICWEDFAGYFDCAYAVRVKRPGQQPQVVYFTEIQNPTNICGDPYLLNPIPAEVDVTGGFCEIAIQIINAVESLGYSIAFDDVDPTGMEDCSKGLGNPLPGFFFLSQVEIMAVLGTDCNNTYDDFVGLDSECDE